MAENNSKAISSSTHEAGEKDAKAPSLIGKAKEEIGAVGKSPKHDVETHGKSEDIDDKTAIDDVKGPGVFGRVKEEIEAVADAFLPKNRPFLPSGPEISPTSLNFNKEIGEELKEVSSKIGSSPPSCDHKCYGCMPCQAIQVPTITSRVGVQYANYEPEGWKCKCGPTLYSP